MHPNIAFRTNDDAALLDHLAENSFATLAGAPDGRPRVAHVPILARRLESGLAIDFHLSRGNALTPFLAAGFQAVLVSLGPHAYVSPDWYGTPDQVPTWNYLAVEVEGPVSMLDEAGLVRLLDDLSAQEEARYAPKPAWTRDKMSTGRFAAMLRGIVGVRLTVERLEGTFKLGQNKSAAEIEGAAVGLGDHPIAARMRAGR